MPMIFKYTLSLSFDSFSIIEYPREVDKEFNGSGLPFFSEIKYYEIEFDFKQAKIKKL